MYTAGTTAKGAFTVTVSDLSKYQSLIIRCEYGNVAGSYYVVDNILELKNIVEAFTVNSKVFWSNSMRCRSVTINITNGTISFSSGYQGNTTDNENYCIPVGIYGIPKA